MKYTLILAALLTACGGGAEPVNYGQCSYDLSAPLVRSWTGSGQKVLFIGDSLIGGLNDRLYFPTRQTMNQGIAGNCTTTIEKRFERDAINMSPEAIVLEGGINDVLRGQLSTKHLKASALLAKMTGIPIVVVGVYGPGPAIEQYRAKITDWNADMAQWSMANGIPYIDNTLPGYEASLDAGGIHLTDYGYTVLTGKIGRLL